MVPAASAEEIYCSTNFEELILVYLKTSNKKQLAAAVTLAVMGTGVGRQRPDRFRNDACYLGIL